MIDDISRSADDHGTDTGGFKYSGRQTDGLMADGSQRYQYRYINLIIKAGTGYCWAVHVHGLALTKLRWHKMKARCHTTDIAGLCRIKQIFQGKIRAPIIRMGGVLIPG